MNTQGMPVLLRKPVRYDLNRNLAGFTIIELMMVMIIVGIVGLLVVPMFSHAGGLRVLEVTEQMAATIRYAQTAAITMQTPYQIVVDQVTEKFEMRDADGSIVNDPINKVAEWSSSHLFSIDFNNHPHFTNITIDSAGFDDSPVLWFDYLGAPYAGPIIDNTPLVSGAIVLRNGSETARIQVEPVTGNVVVNP